MTTETATVGEVSEELLAPEETKLIFVKGVGLEMFASSGVFAPLDESLPIEQRREKVRQYLHQTQEVDDKLGLMQGELLFEVAKNSYWKDYTFTDAKTGETRPYASFEEFCVVEMSMKKRKAAYLMDIYETFVIKLALPKSVLKDLEWTKAREITKVITADNYVELLDKIRPLTYLQVKELADSMKSASKKGVVAEKGGGPAEPDTDVRITFKLSAEQAENVNAALSIAQSMTGSDKKGNQLDLICSEFVAGAVGSGLDGALANLEVQMRNLERAFGVKLKLESVDETRYAPVMAAAEGAPA